MLLVQSLLATFLTSYSAATDGYELKLTTAREMGVMAAEAADFDTVVALAEMASSTRWSTAHDLYRQSGSSSAWHYPYGFGNDYARTLGMKINDLKARLHSWFAALSS